MLETPQKTLESLVVFGEVARSRLLFTRCAYANATRRSAYLLAVARQLKTELNDYLEQAEAWQHAYGQLDHRLRGYYQHCLGEPLAGSRFETCSAEAADLDVARRRLDDDAAPLQRRNQQLTAAVTQYRAEVRDSDAETVETRQDYTQAIQGYARWLAEAYALSAAPAVKPYASKSGCPVVAAPPQPLDAMLPLGDGLLDCFRKITGMQRGMGGESE